MEVVAAVTAAIGADRVGVRISPHSEFQGMYNDSLKHYSHVMTDIIS